MKKVFSLIFLLPMASLSAMDRFSWKNIKYSQLEAQGSPKESKLVTCAKVVAPIVYYTASLAVVGYAGYHVGSELKKSCDDCTAKLESVENLLTMAQNCTDLITYGINYCPSAVQTCMNAFSQCWNNGND